MISEEEIKIIVDWKNLREKVDRILKSGEDEKLTWDLALEFKTSCQKALYLIKNTDLISQIVIKMKMQTSSVNKEKLERLIRSDLNHCSKIITHLRGEK